MLVSRYKLYLGFFLTVFWLSAGWGFIADEIIPALHDIDTIKLIIVDALLAILGFICLKNRFDIGVIVAFLLLSVLSSFILGHETVLTYFNGFRDFIGLLFVVPIIRYFLTSSHAKEFKKTFDKNLLVWLWLQAFCVTWQFFHYGAGDMGGGSFGEGGSGMVSMLIYVVSFYLIAPKWDSSRYWHSLRENWIYIFLLFPTFLNETKVSFILLLAYFVLLVKFDRTLVIRLIYIVPLCVVMIIGSFVAYIAATNQQVSTFLSAETYEDYLYGLDLEELVEVVQNLQEGLYDDDMANSNEWNVDIPRFGKMALILPILNSTRGGLLFGVGIGQFKGTRKGLETTFYKKNEWLLIGSRPEMFVILIQIGLIGLAWLCLILYRLNFGGKTHYPHGKQLRIFIALCFLLLMVYNDSLREPIICIVFFYVLLVLKLNKKEGDNCPVADAM